MDREAPHQSRNSSIELLRLIAMFTIVLHHYSVHGGVFGIDGATLSTLTIAAGASLGKWGVDVFILIASYFLSAEPVATKRTDHLIKFYVQVWTTSILCLCGVYLYDKTSVDFQSVVKSIIPIGYRTWWFATSYFVLYLFHPALNALLSGLSKKQHAQMVGVMLLLWSVSIVLPDTAYAYTHDFGLFIMLYALGSFIRKYVVLKEGSTKWFWRALLLTLLMPLCTMVPQMLSAHYSFFHQQQMFFVTERSPLTIAASVAALLAALTCKIKPSRLINQSAALAFGVYLFTDNPFVCPILWQKIVGTEAQFHASFLPGLMLLSVSAVFLSALGLEFLRQKIIQRPAATLLRIIVHKTAHCVRHAVSNYAPLNKYYAFLTDKS